MRTFYLVVGAVAAYVAYQYFFADDQDDDRPPRPPQTYESSRPQVHRPPIRPQTYEYSQPQVHRPPSRPQTYESSRTYESIQPPVHRHDERQQRQSIDSSQIDHITPEEAYASLRARAKQEGDLRSRCYRQSKEAYKRGDYARAKALSDEQKRHERKRETLHAEASATIFKDACEVDLHGLFVKEAIAYAEKAVTDARQSGYPEIRLIVGQGNHSEKGIPRLKPALQEDLQMRGDHVEADPKNLGVLVVRLKRR
ncbi:hypothetical protein L210DRAFT_3530407 [Boletus edulis BED1]|uniref:Smr domain-containing protein n=1 Tax=Boletus edulis BED1 TaxID=1328754 RepID=A0AAD4BZR2_BOLED|nr:hypothetical protein L210DRAFT_3530407 [Boletus edulis BED1]